MELSSRPAQSGRNFPLPQARSLPAQLFDEWKKCAQRGDFHGAWQISDEALEINRDSDLRGLPEHLRPVWKGESVEGRRVLVRCHHGLGDTIQFSRFIPWLAKTAAEVEVRVQPSLTELLAPFREEAHIVSREEPRFERYEVELEIMELGHVFRIDLNSIPSGVPYLSATPLPVDGSAPVKVGIVWEAGDWDERRSIPFEYLRPWSDVPNVEFYSLQLDPFAAGWRGDFGHTLDASTMLQTAGMMQSLDLIISVDTMAAHLAGALGRPVWTLLQADADWRWMQRRSDSPWYPTMRLFRQTRPGDWEDVARSVADELLTLSEGMRLGGGDRNRTDE